MCLLLLGFFPSSEFCLWLGHMLFGGDNIGANADNLIEDKAVVPDEERAHLEYVDNWLLLGTNKDKVQRLAQAGLDALRGSDLLSTKLSKRPVTSMYWAGNGHRDRGG